MSVATLEQARPKTPLTGHVDVLIVGAGISGLGLGHHLVTKQPGRTFAIVDGRDAIGGTWDLFRYPGIRSDSDLHTFGYEFKPWTSKNAIADADEILDYLYEVVDENDLGRRIYFQHKVVRAAFSTDTALWTVTLEGGGKTVGDHLRLALRRHRLLRLRQRLHPALRGPGGFRGSDRAPAVLAGGLGLQGQEHRGHRQRRHRRHPDPGHGVRGRAHHHAAALTVLCDAAAAQGPDRQRPAKGVAGQGRLRRCAPLQHRPGRGSSTTSARRNPKLARKIIRTLNVKSLPAGYDVDTHFNPTYNPWDQRLCAVPDADLFRAIAKGKASVVTDKIVRFTTNGILLESGKELPADIIVTATGLNMKLFGGIEVSVDGEVKNAHDSLIYKSFMLSGIPNFAFAFGYTNSSWTLKVDLVCDHLCRLLAYMDQHGYTSVVPVDDDPTLAKRPMLDFDAGYILRGRDQFPQQGSSGPWTVEMDYWADHARLRKGPVEDAALRFSTASRTPVTAGAARA